MELVNQLQNLLTADFNDRRSGRVQKFLLDLGIWPEMQPNLVVKAVQASKQRVIPFLFQVHQEIVKIETLEYEKKFHEAKSKFLFMQNQCFMIIISFSICKHRNKMT